MPLSIPRFMVRARQRAAYNLHERLRDPDAFAARVLRMCRERPLATYEPAPDRQADNPLLRLPPWRHDWLRDYFAEHPDSKVAIVTRASEAMHGKTTVPVDRQAPGTAPWPPMFVYDDIVPSDPPVTALDLMLGAVPDLSPCTLPPRRAVEIEW